MEPNLIFKEFLLKIDQLTSRVDQLEDENHRLQQQVDELKVKNAELKARLNTNSTNSNQPPSQDGFSKKPAMPKLIKGLQGGKPGHSGTMLIQLENPGKIIKCLPSVCGCYHTFTGENSHHRIGQVNKDKFKLFAYMISCYLNLLFFGWDNKKW